ncbi:phospho-sugar mutase [bacterium SCSIO 12643]|nr:phospho-sugar mutase [bacterium SCSIO 12643]
MNVTTPQNFIDIAHQWTKIPFDENTQQATLELIEKGGPELEDAFYKNMEFGTGGMRGIMGVGTNRINKYTLGGATQALSDYLKVSFPTEERISVAIAFDCRQNSDVFAQLVADVLSANGIYVYLFEALRPTPELSFAVRHLECQAGIVLTASHNPKEYNGYKVYWNDGAQLVPPHDKGVIDRAKNIQIENIQFEANKDLIQIIGKDLDEAFLDAVVQQSLTNAGKEDLKIVFTSLHGTSINGLPQALNKAGFTDVHIVEAQATPDGTFPTVESPNPEEPSALKMAIDQANEINADLVIGTDPDADRIGIAVRNAQGEMQIMNGNQTASMLTWYLLEQWKQQGKLTGKEFICQTIVTTDLMRDIANAYNVDTETTLTGFKWIADIIRKYEGQKKFIGGGEESFGFMIGDFVRDKDSISSAMIVSEIAALAKSKGSSFYAELLEMYKNFGLYHEGLVSIVKKGKSGSEEISQMMHDLRNNPPKELGGYKVVKWDDVSSGVSTDITTGATSTLSLPSSNVLQFYLENGSKVTARPSGTEPKIKFYFSVKGKLENTADYDHLLKGLLSQIEDIKRDLGI